MTGFGCSFDRELGFAAALCGVALLALGCPSTSDTAGSSPDAAETAAADATSPTADVPGAGADTSAPDTSAPDTSAPDDEDTGPAEGPTLSILVEGVTVSQGDLPAATQTPKPYSYGLQRLELLRSDDDPAPALIFDHSPTQVPVDMHAENLVAQVPMAGLPDDTFTHFRIVLTTLEAEVMATIHEVPVIGTLTTPVHILYALSDVTVDGVVLKQGDARVSVTAAGQTVTTPAHWPVQYPEPAPGAWAVSVDGTTQVTFALAPALTVSPASLADLTYVIRYYVAGAFQWVDEAKPDYSEGVWDVSLGTPPAPEQVVRFGAVGYEVYRKEGP